MPRSMVYQDVCIEAFAHTLPEEVVTSAQIEARLAPLYERLRLPEGRLELMSGIRQRRFWPPGTLPGTQSITTAEAAIEATGIDRRRIGALLHGSVCRDYLEPATAAGVHHGLGLSPDCVVYDVSNACLGLLNGMVQIADMIELGQIRAGLVVGTESARSLVETTIRALIEDEFLTRDAIKPAFASLTIGSGSAAILLMHRSLSRHGTRLLGGVARANTDFCHLCRSDTDASGGDAMSPLMNTDSETLLREGVATARLAFDDFLRAMAWTTAEIDKVVCHQVGRAHERLLLETLGIEPSKNVSTVEYLGNTGSVALPTTASVAAQEGQFVAGNRIALLGIGSGINTIMLAVEWGGS